MPASSLEDYRDACARFNAALSSYHAAMNANSGMEDPDASAELDAAEIRLDSFAIHSVHASAA